MVGAAINGHADRRALGWETREERKRPAPTGRSFVMTELAAPPQSRNPFFGSQQRTSGDQLAAALGFDLSPAVGAESLTDLYRENGWARIAIKAFATALASLPFGVLNANPLLEKEARAIPGHPLPRLLGNPNPLFTEAELWESHIKAYKLDGEVYWFLATREGKPLSGTPMPMRLTQAPELIFLVRGSAVEVKTNELGFPISYRYSSKGGKPIEFEAHSVVPFVDHDPKNMLRGVGDGESAWDQAALMFRAERYLDSSLQHGGDPGCWITYEERVAADELERRKAMLDEESDNESQNARRYTVLDSTAKVTPKPSTISLAEYPKLLNHWRDSILAFFGVPGPIVGIYDNGTFSNVQTAHREFWGGVNGVLALARQICDVVRNRLLLRLAAIDSSWDGWPAFDASHVSALKEIRGEQMERAARISAMGIGIAHNEVMRAVGTNSELPELGDVKLLTPLLGKVNSEEEIPAAGEVDPGEDEDETDEAEGDSAKSGDGERGLVPVPTISRRAILSARAKRAVTKKPDERLERNVARWFRRFGEAEIRHLRAIAVGKRGLARDPVSRWLTRVGSIGLDAIIKTGSQLTAEDIRLLDMALGAWEKALAKLTGSRIEDIFATAASETAKDIGAAVLDVTSPGALRKLAAHVAELSEGVTSTLAQQVRTTILRAFAEDDGPAASLREVLRRNLPELEGSLAKAFATKEQRAMTIARTETNWARQNAAFDQMKDAGVTMVEWASADDQAVRTEHQALDGTIVPLGQEFAPRLRYPMDPQAPADQVINCRCGLLAAAFEGDES